eukprot:gnl/Dysnectes_brevis/3172_a3957_1381.p1 GENE.gnl/Dysnectes_brevis/3172_a3957_1381~~gnl/Dysnectes_brevis/3172_a3957_1381.p1  ORF type:complete len:206 (+),score=25.73 gnl/Dysnectes_brevis/3172_a3957_1381:29-619(+)
MPPKSKRASSTRQPRQERIPILCFDPMLTIPKKGDPIYTQFVAAPKNDGLLELIWDCPTSKLSISQDKLRLEGQWKEDGKRKKSALAPFVRVDAERDTSQQSMPTLISLVKPYEGPVVARMHPVVRMNTVNKYKMERLESSRGAMQCKGGEEDRKRTHDARMGELERHSVCLDRIIRARSLKSKGGRGKGKKGKRK